MNYSQQAAQRFLSELRGKAPELHAHILNHRQSLGDAQATQTSPFWDTIREGISTYATIYAQDKQREAQAEQAKIDAQNALMAAQAQAEEARIRAETQRLERQFAAEQAQIQSDLNAFKNEKITEVALWAAALFGGFFWLRSQGMFK